MTPTTIIPASNEYSARLTAAYRRIPADEWTWCLPADADAYAARCVAFGVDARVLTTPPAARTVVVRPPHERSAA